MTATASAGYNYMQEGIEYAVSGEIPCVILDVQRVRGENFATQADIMQARWGAAGDHEMIVLAPSSVQELFDQTVRAFNLAEKYRMPVVVLSETTIALMREKLVIPEPGAIEIINRKRPEGPPGEFVPFKAGPNDVPALPKFGEGYRILHSINPHDEWGGIQWDPDVFEKMVDRILGKVTAHRDDIVQTEGFFLDDAKTVLIAYGSESRPALGAVKEARANGIKVGLLKLVTVWPVPDKEIRAVAEKADKVLAVEMNVGRYAYEIERIGCDASKVVRVTKNRGLVHTTQEIYQAIEEATR
jgi:2-oxoglutarate ferredoxin oxidoreductase subunit alpha